MRRLWVRSAKTQGNDALDSAAATRQGCAMTVTDTIRRKLTEAFAPVELIVTDDSARHVGHAGHRPGGETHFTVKIVSAAFTGLSRVERQRRVYAVLGDEMKSQIHALALTTQTPDE
jgi:BolA family transcriptional regulator, general stress-responsive regulator